MSARIVIVCDGCGYKAEGLSGQRLGSLRNELDYIRPEGQYRWLCGFGDHEADYCHECKSGHERGEISPSFKARVDAKTAARSPAAGAPE